MSREYLIRFVQKGLRHEVHVYLPETQVPSYTRMEPITASTPQNAALLWARKHRFPTYSAVVH